MGQSIVVSINTCHLSNTQKTYNNLQRLLKYVLSFVFIVVSANVFAQDYPGECIYVQGFGVETSYFQGGKGQTMSIDLLKGTVTIIVDPFWTCSFGPSETYLDGGGARIWFWDKDQRAWSYTSNGTGSTFYRLCGTQKYPTESPQNVLANGCSGLPVKNSNLGGFCPN